MLELFKRFVVQKCFTVRRIRDEMLQEGWDLSEYSDAQLVRAMRKLLSGVEVRRI